MDFRPSQKVLIYLVIAHECISIIAFHFKSRQISDVSVIMIVLSTVCGAVMFNWFTLLMTLHCLPVAKSQNMACQLVFRSFE